MDKNELWNIFLKTGKVQDYLAYSKAENNLQEYSSEIAQEFFSEDFELERKNYANQDDWRGDT